MDKVAPWISGTDMAGFYISFDSAKLDAWIERARTSASRSNSSLSKAFRGIQGEMMEDFSSNLPSFMKKVGLGQRSGRMAGETSVEIIRRTATDDGGELVVRVSGPDYIMIHETGGVITPKRSQYLKVPFIAKGRDPRSGSIPVGEEGTFPGLMSQQRTKPMVAGRGFFVMRKGKGGRQLKVPLLMERFPDVSGEAGGGEGSAQRARANYRQSVKALHREPHYKNMTGSEKEEANDYLRKQYEHEVENAAPEAFPVASLRKQVFIPRRPWLSLAVQHFNSKMGTTVKGTKVIYGASGFEYDFGWGTK